MSIKKFLTSKVFLYNIIGALLLVVAIIFGTLFTLDIYTHHGQKIEVPDFKGLNLSMAKRICVQNEIRYQVIDSVFSHDFIPGTVIDQNPRAGFNVKENRTIFLTICAQNPEQIKLPKLTDKSLRQAKAILINAGLHIGQITFRPSEFVDLVLEQKIEGENAAPGTMVYKGSSVDLVIGEGLSMETTTVPNLYGMKLSDARDYVLGTTLSIGAVIYDKRIETEYDSLNARVWKQLPEISQKEVKKGTSIDIWISMDEKKFIQSSRVEDVN